MNNSTATWLTPAWFQMGLNAMKESLDPSTDVKLAVIKFLLETGLWNAERTSHDAAIARYNGNLDPSKNVQFKMVEIWAAMKFTGRHQLFHAMAEDLGYEYRLKPTDEREQQLLAQLVAEMTRHNNICEFLGGQLGGLTSVEQLRIHPSFREGPGGGTFDIGNGF